MMVDIMSISTSCTPYNGSSWMCVIDVNKISAWSDAASQTSLNEYTRCLKGKHKRL